MLQWLRPVPESATMSERKGMSEKARQKSALSTEQDSLKSQKAAAVAKIKAIDARTKQIRKELKALKEKSDVKRTNPE